MKRIGKNAVSHWLVWLMVLLLFSTTAAPAWAEDSSMTPDALVYENGNIVLSKYAEPTGPGEWKVTVRATVGELPVEKRRMEVVLLLDISSSMNTTAHTHSDECYALVCTENEHTHSEACYDLSSLTCGLEAHAHTDACYVTGVCDQEEHTHTAYTGSCYTECTRTLNPSHYNNRGSHRNNTSCVSTGNGNNRKYYTMVCELDEHTHSSACQVLDCGMTVHSHTEACGELLCTEVEHTHSDDCYGTEIACGYTDTSRFGVAAQAAERLIANLPEGTDITRLAFATNFYSDVSSYYDLETSRGTYMWTAISNTLSDGYFTENDTKKIFVILTDGEATDSSKKSVAESLLDEFKDPDGTNGSVFTVGFAYDDEDLAAIAGNGGYYMYAENASELTAAFDKLEQTLTAMLEDPMSGSVVFDKTSIQEIQTSGGVVSSDSDTIYWHPAEDGSDTVRNSTIEYNYTVKLNDLADMTAGVHSDIPLNNPTYFYYGIKDDDGVTDMKAAPFPIPEVTYAVSTLQTHWQANGTDILTPTELETVISNYVSATYIPTFTQDYSTITPVIPVAGSNDYYRYIGTTVTADGAALDGVEAVDATQPLAYVVIHQYERVESNELAVGGSKTLIGRDFLPGDSFTFTLTAVTPGAPMPEESTVTITPESGTTMAFSFGAISYAEAGTYTYTLQEQPGSAEQMIYDTTVHTLVVTATEVSSEIVISYTMDGVENGHLLITNRLETGELKVEKQTVTSHLPEHQEKEFGFLISLRDSSNRLLSGAYPALFSDGTSQSLTFTNGYAAVMLRAGESVVISGIPDGASYTVTEDAAGGFTATFTGDTGVIAANQQSTAAFSNEYHATGLYQFIGVKQLENASLTLDQFTFSVLDESGQVVARGKNNTDGSFFLDTLYFTEADIGTKTYTIVEDLGSVPGVIYDRTRRQVTLTITDLGDGMLSITDDLNGTPLTFTNRFITDQLTVSKTVVGNVASQNRAFSFTLSLPDMAGQNLYASTDGGETFESLTLNEQGQADFTLKHGQSFIMYPASGSYTVTETDAGSYTTTYTINQGDPVEGSTASGTADSSGVHVAFVNTLQTATPTGIHTSCGSAAAGIILAACLIIITAKRRCCSLEH
ncbi:MAG: VWA domain-containing protein [Clostridia bacterium]|nr:VWA domain-containing protein [Clostridia bacterium]